MAYHTGRPLKYAYLLKTLEQDSLYKPSTIAVTLDVGHLPKDEQVKARRRARLCLGRMAKSRDFPPFGDGILNLPGQAPAPAWYGWRWQRLTEIEIPVKSIKKNHEETNAPL